MEPRFGVVFLTQGKRPDDLHRALACVLPSLCDDVELAAIWRHGKPMREARRGADRDAVDDGVAGRIDHVHHAAAVLKIGYVRVTAVGCNDHPARQDADGDGGHERICWDVNHRNGTFGRTGSRGI